MNDRYFTLWRWHFYMGLFVAPLLMLLSITGLAMIFFAHTEGKDSEYVPIPVQSIVKPLSVQAKAALDKIDPEHGMVAQYISPRSADLAAIFRVNDGDGKASMVIVDPYTAEVLKVYPRNQNMYHLMDEIHSDILMGTVGDYLLETAAALTILLILTGWYLWFITRKGKILTTGKIGRGRSLWRSIHGVLGTYASLMLLLFCLSGMAWAGVWGGKMVQSWSQFPAGKWGVAPNPESTLPTHGEELNDGKTKEIPWILELTPMPVSGSTLGENGINPNEPITLDTVDRFVREKGFTNNGRYQIYFPKDEKGVWTINQDSMSYDSPNPTADRTMHIDRYSGKILADIFYDDYNAFGKFMAASIAIHMGTMGWWSVTINVIFCLAVIFLCISGYVMWWKRRPTGAALCPPPGPQKIWKEAIIVLMIVAVVFPTAAIAIVLFYLLDCLVISRIAILQKWLK